LPRRLPADTLVKKQGRFQSICYKGTDMESQDGDAVDDAGDVDWVKNRRQLLAPYIDATNENLAFLEAEEPEPIGLAFSGGGIRSATISLGIAQLLVRRNRFSAFDYVSTASGGGYFGSFLRSLFLPQSAKGRQAAGAGKLHEQEVRDQFYYAHSVLGAGPKKGNVPLADQIDAIDGGSQVNFEEQPARPNIFLRILGRLVGHGHTDIDPHIAEATGGGERNPIWWLRENGRYLAPNGSTDYMMALSYIARNWTATLFVITLAMVGAFTALQIGLTAIVSMIPGPFENPLSTARPYLSPFLVVPIFCFLLSVGIGVGYWMTEGMRYNPSDDGEARRSFWATWSGTAIAFAVALYLVTATELTALQSIYDRIQQWLSILPKAQLNPVQMLPALAQSLIYTGTAVLGMSLLSSFLAYFLDGDKANPTSPVRRRLTRWSTVLNQVAAWCLAIAIIDTLALMLRAGTLGWQPSNGLGPLLGLAIYPAIAFLIKKMPEWFSGSGGGISSWIAKHASTVAVFGAISLYASLAVLSDLAVHMALWSGVAWLSLPDWPSFLLFVTITFALIVMTGISSGFANLSSLHALYSSRLTRAYLGASNRARMKSALEISEGHEKDFIDAQVYSQADIPAPLHIINLTLNQTRGTNQLVRRDRKGRRFAIRPDGISVDGAVNHWINLNAEGAEKFSVGQLAAISGAAASSAMGRMTSLGAALGLTFANVRLGYWWDRGNKALRTGDEGLAPLPARWPRMIETFIYLYNEMTSRFSLDYRHYYLSDGGHSENSGALELLRQRCKFILVADNGQDEDFLFADLEIFIRTARIDLGFEISVASDDDTVEYVGQKAARYFFNTLERGWRRKLKDNDGFAFALLLTARLIGDKKAGGSSDEDDFTAHIVWLKPRIFEGISTDIASYAAQNVPFPHQTTIDQFFDEAQWESYRRLGYEMASCLFRDDKAFADVPIMRLKKPEEVVVGPG
jgi:hypothetical protein